MNLTRFAIAAAALLSLAFVATPASAQASCPPFDTSAPFTDGCYHEYLLYNVDAAEIDVLILPSASPYALRDSILMEQSVSNWDTGINTVASNLGLGWLGTGINLHAYSVGLDYVPPEVLWDPEIVIVPAEFNPVLLFGIGLQGPLGYCHNIPYPFSIGVGDVPTGPMANVLGNPLGHALSAMPGFHQHGDNPWGMLSYQCQPEKGGYTCFVVNTNFLDIPDANNRQDMFDLNSHELGHCLGIGHVGDALDFSSTAYPDQDIMSYQSEPSPYPVHCVSTLNVRALEQTYGHMLLGAGSGYPVWSAGGYVHMDPDDWDAPACTQPTATHLNTTPVTTADPLGPWNPL